jgi:hypothetical protein
MKNNNARIFAVVIAIGTIASLVAPIHANAACSIAASAGNWSMTDNGTVVGIGPRTAVAVFRLDGKGNLTDGVGVSSLNGSIAGETFTGTYTLNPDCSGSASAKIYSGGVQILQLTAFIAFDDNMKELRMLFTSVSTPDGTPLPSVISLQARKQ